MADGPSSPGRSIEVFALDVGQGDATLIVLPDGRTILFDCADDWVVGKVIETWGIVSLSAVIASHLDRDHIGGMQGFLQNFVKGGGHVERVFLDTDGRSIAETTPRAALAKSLIDYVITGAERHQWKVYSVTTPETPIASGPGWTVRLVAPTQSMRLAHERAGQDVPNALSGVLRLEIGGQAVLLGGDAPLKTFAALAPEDLRSKVFRIPHHGGALTDGGVPEGWDAARLYAAIGPELAILSVGKGHDHPEPAWIHPVTGGAPCRLLCTQVTRRCEPTIVGEPKLLRASAVRSPHFAEPPWRHLNDRHSARQDRYEIPCAGTVLVELHENGTLRVLPSRDGPHQQLVNGWRSPLCRPTMD